MNKEYEIAAKVIERNFDKKKQKALSDLRKVFGLESESKPSKPAAKIPESRGPHLMARGKTEEYFNEFLATLGPGQKFGSGDVVAYIQKKYVPRYDVTSLSAFLTRNRDRFKEFMSYELSTVGHGKPCFVYIKK